MRQRLGLWALLLTLSCNVSQGEYLEDYPHKSCRVAKRCDPEGFANLYGSLAKCEDVVRSYQESRAETCDYDADAAKECLKALDDASCNEYPEECDYDIFYDCFDEEEG